MVGAARRSFATGIDSLLASPDPDAQALARAIRDLRLDPTSFSVGRIGPDPAVSFLAPGEGEWAVDLAVPMSPIAVAAPAWWSGVRVTLPSSPAGSPDQVWARPGTGVVARLDAAEDLVTVILRDSAQQEWKAARLPPPVERILWLDAPPIDSITRRGLRRAFDDAALYSAETRIAASAVPRAGGPVTVHTVAYPTPRVTTPKRSATLRPGSSSRRLSVPAPWGRPAHASVVTR